MAWPFLMLDAVEDLRVADDLEPADGLVGELGEEGEEGGDAADAGDHAGLFGDDGAGGAQGGIDGERGGDVVGGLVLEEGGFEEGGDAAGFPVHDGTLRCPLFVVRCSSVQAGNGERTTDAEDMVSGVHALLLCGSASRAALVFS